MLRIHMQHIHCMHETYVIIYRLTTVSSLHMHIGLNFSGGGPKMLSSNRSPTQQMVTSTAADADEALLSSLIKHFEGIQEKHTEFRLSLLRQKSLLLPTSQSSSALMAAGAVPGLPSLSLPTAQISAPTSSTSTAVGQAASGFSLAGNSS